MKRVEGVGELFLRLLFAFQKLNVIDEQDVDRAVAIAKFARFVILDRGDEFVGEGVRGNVDYSRLRVAAKHAMTDGVHQVSLAQADRAVDEKRIVRARCRFCDGLRSRVREAVGRTYDELLKGVAFVKPGEPEIIRTRLRVGCGLAEKSGTALELCRHGVAVALRGFVDDETHRDR